MSNNNTNSALPFNTIDDLTKQCRSDFCNDDNSVKQIEDLVNARFEEIQKVVQERYLDAISARDAVPHQIEFSLERDLDGVSINITEYTGGNATKDYQKFEEGNSCIMQQPLYFRRLYFKQLRQKLIEFGFADNRDAYNHDVLQLVVTPWSNCFEQSPE